MQQKFGWFSREERRLSSLVWLGLLLGAVFGLWNLVATGLDPLAEDTVPALLVFYSPMFTAWGLAGFAASRRTGRIVDGVIAGAVLAFVTFAVFVVARILVINLFLEVTSQRLDWQSLNARFEESGFESLRAFAIYEYVMGAPFKILVASTIGAFTGAVGGLIGRTRHPKKALAV
jgi:hypothetical protein